MFQQHCYILTKRKFDKNLGSLINGRDRLQLITIDLTAKQTAIEEPRREREREGQIIGNGVTERL